ncbi:MAG: RibD family protein, partial [Acidobacteria bacterium]|nr:RibD family protein [Acidobacteriota bacterium]
HRLRAESDAILVGAGTIRRDDPSLTVRDHHDPAVPERGGLDPRRIVLGAAPPGAAVHPCTEVQGDLGQVLDRLGGEGVVQLLVEGGAAVAGEFHRAGLVDRYVIYLAPALFGGSDARGLFGGHGAFDIAELWRGRFTSVERVGDDLRVELEPLREPGPDQGA